MARKTYIATADGYLSAEGRAIKEGETFSTDAPQGSWMEEVSDGTVRKERKRVEEIVEAEIDKPDGSGPPAGHTPGAAKTLSIR